MTSRSQPRHIIPFTPRHLETNPACFDQADSLKRNRVQFPGIQNLRRFQGLQPPRPLPYTSSHILYLQDKNGDENWRLYRVDFKKGIVDDLTPYEGVRAEVIAASPDDPDTVIIGLNRRVAEWHDIYRLHSPAVN